jgi:hypothetical protein
MNYKESIDFGVRLEMIINSAMPTRRAKLNKEMQRYKELLGTIVGNRVWKITHSGKA